MHEKGPTFVCKSKKSGLVGYYTAKAPKRCDTEFTADNAVSTPNNVSQ